MCFAELKRRLAVCPVWAAFLLAIPLSVTVSLPVAIAETDPMDAPMEIVRFGEADTIRGVVGQYLGDPDLWPAVLALNDIRSPADLVPGIELRLPVRQVAAADQALVASLDAIQRANAEGAQIFAPVEIAQAIENRDTAVQRRETGEWRQVVSFAGRASDYAKEALDISIAQRDRSAEALVSDVQGDVEGRAPVEPGWSERDLNDILVEYERLRTLSSSTAQVTFRDLSRLRLNPNSNATIQRMRSDPLTGGETTKVSLAEGDFYALLNQLSDKTTFEIEVPGIQTTTNSADFWVKNDASGARFVNYDKSGLEVSQDGKTVQLGAGEGMVVTDAGTQRVAVLDSPRLVSPVLGSVIYTGATDLAWEPFDGAEAYWLEISRDPGFNQMQVSEWGIRGTGFRAEALPPASYYWRVAALDRLGLPGQWSTPQDFSVRLDDTPPFLTLLSPGPGELSTAPQTEVLGASEGDAIVVLNGAPVDLGSDGSFLVTVALVPGTNLITVRATDPAGNSSERSREVIYRPSVSVSITLSEAIPRVGEVLASRTGQLSVFGRTDAATGAPVVVRDALGGVAVQTRVGDDGALQFNVPVADDLRGFTVEVLSPAGETEGTLTFSGIRDQVAPVVTFDLPPPRAVGESPMALSGSVDDAVRLDLDGTPVPLADGRFDLSITLDAGQNDFDLTATDAVGNVSLTRISTLLDVEPPVVSRVDLTRPEGDAGPIRIEVAASDQSGLRQAASYVIRVGNAERTGFLRCDAQGGICSATLPPEPGDLSVVEIAIEDYAGNVAFE